MYIRVALPVSLFTVQTCIYIHCSAALWDSLTGINVETNPCRIRTDNALLFYGLAAREAITQPLNLVNSRYLTVFNEFI